VTDIMEPNSHEILAKYGVQPEEGIRINIRSTRAGKYSTYEMSRALAVDSMTRQHRFQEHGLVVFESDTSYEIKWDEQMPACSVRYEWIV
jgi:hypothetical protein